MTISGKILPAATTVIAAIAIMAWLGLAQIPPMAERVPGADRHGVPVDLQVERPLDHYQALRGPGTPAEIPGAWPQFRGPNLDAIAPPGPPLAREWPEAGPSTLWEIDVGEGYGGPAVRDGAIYLMDYDREQSADALRCLSLADGREIWRHTYPLRVKRNHGMTRTVPAVAGDAVIAIGPLCHVSCVDARTGGFRWGLDLVADYGATVPPWYAGQNPLVDGDRVILATGGPALLIAVDLATGAEVWRSPNPVGWTQTHASIVPATLQGRRAYLYSASGGLAAIAADTGELLWHTDVWKINIATIASPIVVDEQRIFVSGGYNAGAMMLRLGEADGRFLPTPEFRLKPAIFGATQQTPILYRQHLYGIRPNGEFVCLDLDGKVRWASGTDRFGLGPFLLADELLLVLNDDGVLSMIEASPDHYRLLGRAQVLHGHESWAPLAIVDGRLLVRDFTRLACLDLRATIP